MLLHAQVLAAKGHRAVLDLPRACHLPDLEMLIYQVCRLGPSLVSCCVSFCRESMSCMSQGLDARPPPNTSWAGAECSNHA